MRKPLMLMRTRGISGPRFGKHANHTRTLSKSAGTQIALGISAVPVINTLPLNILNGNFAGATRDHWTDQDVGSFEFEVFDGKTALKMESGGTFTMFKQAVAVTPNQLYSITVELHNNNNVNGAEVFIFDGDLENVAISNAQSGDLLVIEQTAPSTLWQTVTIPFEPTQNVVTICLAAGGVATGRFHEVTS